MQSELASAPAWTDLDPRSLAVRTADEFTAREVLRLRMAVGQGPDWDPASEYYWAELLRDCSEADVLDAAWDHYRRHSRPLWPADILDWVAAAAVRRRDEATLARELELAKRVAGGWGEAALARWSPIFDVEIARGGGPDAAARAADAAAAPQSRRSADSTEDASYERQRQESR